MKCSTTALFKTVLHFFIQPPKNVFIALKSCSSRYVILFLNLVSKHSPQQCSDPSILKKGRCDSILAWINAPPLPFSKLYCTFLYNTPNFFLLHFKVGQADMLCNF